MSARFITINRDTSMLLPLDLREWVPDNHRVHVIVDAVDGLPMVGFKVNHRGTGDKQYPPTLASNCRRFFPLRNAKRRPGIVVPEKSLLAAIA